MMVERRAMSETGRHRPPMAAETGMRARIVGVLVSVVVAASACGSDDGMANRHADVAARGAEVMPFDLDATTHRFTKTPDGGIQTVTADDPHVPAGAELRYATTEEPLVDAVHAWFDRQVMDHGAHAEAG